MSKRPLYIPFAGPALLEAPLLNKGSAFSEFERQQFNLEGLLPCAIETIEEQIQRAQAEYDRIERDVDKHIYLRNLQDTNETLYYRFVIENLEAILPIIYTPTVGEVCQKFSHIYRRKRGLFISYPDRNRIEDMLQNATKQNVKIIVVTDGERILGLGDLGIGGMGIPIGKLALYTVCGGISAAYTLPVVLDVGTNNKELIEDPMYMGWRHERIKGDEYYAFVDQFIQAIKIRWPNAMLQFEDFAQGNAMPLLQRYRDKLCCFNDDIQGTAAVTVGTLIAACSAKGDKVKDQTVVFAGAGSAGCGIAEQIIDQMVREGLSDNEARKRVFLLDSRGLILADDTSLSEFQTPLTHTAESLAEWQFENDKPQLIDVVQNARPTVLIGVAARANLFNEDIVTAMYEHCRQPIILPLSNPTSKAEAKPEDIVRWTNGNAIIATGSPFDDVEYKGKLYPVAQCNNSYIFPGLGLGAIAAGAQRITQNMMLAASEALAEQSPLVQEGQGALLPAIANIRNVSSIIAKAVYIQAMKDGVAPQVCDELMAKNIARNVWEPAYRHYRRTSF